MYVVLLAVARLMRLSQEYMVPTGLSLRQKDYERKNEPSQIFLVLGTDYLTSLCFMSVTMSFTLFDLFVKHAPTTGGAQKSCIHNYYFWSQAIDSPCFEVVLEIYRR